MRKRKHIGREVERKVENIREKGDEMEGERHN